MLMLLYPFFPFHTVLFIKIILFTVNCSGHCPVATGKHLFKACEHNINLN